MRRSLAAPLLALALAVAGCKTVRTVTPDPVPPAEPLKQRDCAAAAQRYQVLLEQPPQNPLERLPPSAPSADAFAAQCRERLAGHTRRAVRRCWTDADSAATFLACSERF